MNISKHAKQRYVERVAEVGKEDIKLWTVQNDEKIKHDISELVEHGECIYCGKKSDTHSEVDVVVNRAWVILLSSDDKTVVTLFRVNLGLGEAFDKEYVDKMVDKLEGKKAAYHQVCDDTEAMNKDYQQICDDLEQEIAEYKISIKNMESLLKSYKDVINGNNVMKVKAKREMEQVINTLVDKKIF